MKKVILVLSLSLLFVPYLAFGATPSIESLQKEIIELKAQIKILKEELNSYKNTPKAKKTKCSSDINISSRKDVLESYTEQTEIKITLDSNCDLYGKLIPYRIQKNKKVIYRGELGMEDITEDDNKWKSVIKLPTNIGANGLYTYTFEYDTTSTSIDIEVHRSSKANKEYKEKEKELEKNKKSATYLDSDNSCNSSGSAACP
ncbi:DivIVA domain-containing protein [Candidatus Nomurabacteria bacterium]|nr:DivIVA domain-containing protein [Candidatus Nomurabacteria bacterium]